MSRKGSPKGEAVNSHFGLSPTLKTSKLQGVQVSFSLSLCLFEYVVHKSEVDIFLRQTRSQTAKRDRNMTPIQDLKVGFVFASLDEQCVSC